jgi:hypothetical protein
MSARTAHSKKLEKANLPELVAEPDTATAEAARQQRAIYLIAGLWSKRADAPKDGLA